jgi:hypothetical protein
MAMSDRTRHPSPYPLPQGKGVGERELLQGEEGGRAAVAPFFPPSSRRRVREGGEPRAAHIEVGGGER